MSSVKILNWVSKAVKLCFNFNSKNIIYFPQNFIFLNSKPHQQQLNNIISKIHARILKQILVWRYQHHKYLLLLFICDFLVINISHYCSSYFLVSLVKRSLFILAKSRVPKLFFLSWSEDSLLIKLKVTRENYTDR